ncbi:hypothetical protein BaRGS_00036483 [Batillaria attramentaria]|uniref:Uncharacterized protein n=1 Tax=Batillaria attramentaria TaxID=370345 RepID=A0ABD0JBN1_9CAEN
MWERAVRLVPTAVKQEQFAWTVFVREPATFRFPPSCSSPAFSRRHFRRGHQLHDFLDQASPVSSCSL